MKKNDKQLLIFDIDGVLVDVTNSYRQAIKQTAEFFTGKEILLKEIQDYKNKGGFINDWNLTGAIITKNGFKINKEKIIDKFQSYYNKLMKNEKWLLDQKILNELLKNYELAILTGRPREEAINVLENFSVISYFSEIIAMENVEKEKPNPEGLLKILKKFNAKNAFYFGDTIDDVKAAVSANINAIGVLPPSDKSEELKNLLLKNGAKIVIENINQIRSVLK
jgi:HAD superfamily phosphatase